MSLTTYTGLKASIASFLHRTDLTDQVPDFIALAEAQMNRRLRVRKMVARSTAPLSDEYSAVPDDFAGVITFALDGKHLTYVTPDQMETLASCPESGKPRYYSVVGGEFRYFPTPGTPGDTGSLTYWKRIPALSDTNATNWLLDAHPDAYLYGALTQAAPFVMDDERLGTWGTLFTTALSDIEQADAESYGALTPVPSFAP